MHRPADLLRRALLFALGMMAGAAIAAGVAVAVDSDGSSGGGAFVNPAATVTPIDPLAPGAIQPGVTVDLGNAAGTVDPVTHGFFEPAAAGASLPGHTGVAAISAEELTQVLAGDRTGPAHGGVAAISAEALYRVLAGETAAPAHDGAGAISPEELAQLLRGMP